MFSPGETARTRSSYPDLEHDLKHYDLYFYDVDDYPDAYYFAPRTPNNFLGSLPSRRDDRPDMAPRGRR